VDAARFPCDDVGFGGGDDAAPRTEALSELVVAGECIARRDTLDGK
jgi:hypothetical protein